jgi:hypothetical protein
VLERIAIIGVLNFLVYYRTLFFSYVGDDVERSERQQEFKNLFHRWWMQFIGLKHRNPMVSHAMSLVTHTICCISIYVCLGASDLSFLASILFSLNPVNMQGSIWISGRNYVVSAILTLFMFLLPKISWLFYMATSYFAVNAWFSPIGFLGTNHWYMVGIIPVIWLLTQHNRATLNRKIWETGGLKTTNTEMRSIKPKKIIPFLKTYMYYFLLCIFPYHLGLEHNFLRGFGTNKTDNDKGYKIDLFFFIGLILFLGVTITSIYGILNGWLDVTWGLFWFTINIAMWCNFITIQQQISERYVYLANIGMMYALASVILYSPVLITIFIVAYLVRLWYVLDMYLSDYWAVEHTIIDMKKMHYMWLMRGVKKFLSKDHVGALMDFNEAYMQKPYDLKILFNLSTTYLVLGDVINAKAFLQKAKENVYDELGNTVDPAFKSVEDTIKFIEDARARGETNIQLDLKNIMVVK